MKKKRRKGEASIMNILLVAILLVAIAVPIVVQQSGSVVSATSTSDVGVAFNGSTAAKTAFAPVASVTSIVDASNSAVTLADGSNYSITLATGDIVAAGQLANGTLTYNISYSYYDTTYTSGTSATIIALLPLVLAAGIAIVMLVKGQQ